MTRPDTCCAGCANYEPNGGACPARIYRPDFRCFAWRDATGTVRVRVERGERLTR